MKFSDVGKRSPLVSVYENAFAKVQTQVTTDPVQLRPSGFPTCSILHYLYMEYLNQHKVLAEEKTLFSEFFTSVGTTVHTVMQKWVGMSGQIYGDWKCAKCDTVRRMVGHLCPKCNSLMEYIELEVEYGLIKGHVDGVLQLPNKRFWPLDYKTATLKKIEQAHLLLPIKQNVFQILTYSLILKHKYELDIAGCSLLYIARNNPKVYHECQFVFDEETEALALRIVKKEQAKHAAAIKAVKTKNVNVAIAAKPCKSVKHHDQFFGEYHNCPLIDVCFESDKKLVKRIDQILDDGP